MSIQDGTTVTSGPRAPDVRAVYEAVGQDIVGRTRELNGILATVASGRDLLLEGPPGTGKSTILRSITEHYGIPLVLVEGNADLTPNKMLGYHDPAAVLRHGYRAEDFVPGPLPAAMQDGAFLYVEEFNRVPEDTLNTLLSAMAERAITIPRVGRITALPSFRIVAAMNPFDNIGTGRISASIYDRICRLAVDYQDEEAEREIVARRTGVQAGRTVTLAVALARATRNHPDLRTGSSVRGAIDLVKVAQTLARMHDLVLETDLPQVLLDAALLALSSKVAVAGVGTTTPEDVITDLVRELEPSVAPLGR